MALYSLYNSSARDPLVASTIFFMLAITTTIARICSRLCKNIKLEADDYLTLGALLTLSMLIAIEYAATITGGIGRHMMDVAVSDAIKTLKLVIPFEIFYGITLMLAKLAVLCFYLRVFGSKRNFRVKVYVTMAVVIIWAISLILVTLFLYWPFALNWDNSVKGSCGNRKAFYLAVGLINVITDVMMISLPLSDIWRLQLSLQSKVGLLIIFSLGFITTIISIIRLISIQNVNFTDPTYSLRLVAMWSTIEPGLAIINTNLPMLQQSLHAITHRFLKSANSSVRHSVESLNFKKIYNRFSSAPFGRLGRGTTNDIIPLASIPTRKHTREDLRYKNAQAEPVTLSRILVRKDWTVEWEE